MCKCTPEIRTPFCGKPGCQWPKDERRLLLPPRIAVLSSIDYHQAQADLQSRRVEAAIMLLAFHNREIARWGELLRQVEARGAEPDDGGAAFDVIA